MALPSVYVDGESHFIRSEHFWKKLHGDTASLETARQKNTASGGTIFPNSVQPYLVLERRCKFFWDKPLPMQLFHYFGDPIHHAVYFTSFAGAENDLHDMKVFIRSNGFEPSIVKERSDLAQRRATQVADLQLLEKPKGVDIALAVRLLEDAYRHLFDRCLLFTSDVDFVPVIHAIQHLGRKVIVFGFKDGLGKQSDLEYVPDVFFDLGPYMQQWYTPS